MNEENEHYFEEINDDFVVWVFDELMNDWEIVESFRSNQWDEAIGLATELADEEQVVRIKQNNEVVYEEGVI